MILVIEGSSFFWVFPIIIMAAIFTVLGKSRKGKNTNQKYKNAVTHAVIDMYDRKVITITTHDASTFMSKNDEDSEMKPNPLEKEILRYGFGRKTKVSLKDFNDRMAAGKNDLIATAKTIDPSKLRTDNPNQRMSTSHQDNNDASFAMVLLIPALAESETFYYGSVSGGGGDSHGYVSYGGGYDGGGGGSDGGGGGE